MRCVRADVLSCTVNHLEVDAGEEHTTRNVPPCTKDKAPRTWWGRGLGSLWGNADLTETMITRRLFSAPKKGKRTSIVDFAYNFPESLLDRWRPPA